MKITDKINLHHTDCMDFMRDIPDGYYELAIVDPPYGIGGGVDNRKAIETKSGNNLKRLARKGGMEWDRNIPKKRYFDELKRISKNQIIWGGNYMIENLDNTRCFIVWDKMTYIPSMSQIELAWSSFASHSQLVKINSNQNERIHISQKPVALYKYLLDKYAKPNDKILDTHGGSMSIAIACHDYGFDLDLCELDKEYFDKGVQRVKNHVAQQKLF
jgi:site-specific DNA-methyltransferase (adenine-specific)